MRLWMLPAASGSISSADQLQILIGFETGTGSLPSAPNDQEYVRRYLWDTL